LIGLWLNQISALSCIVKSIKSLILQYSGWVRMSSLNIDQYSRSNEWVLFVFVTFDIMSNAILNRICNDENDPMLGVKICCKHGDLLSMQTSWSKDNPGRRFWSCPRYRVCTFLHLSLETSLYFVFFFNLNFFVVCILGECMQLL